MILILFLLWISEGKTDSSNTAASGDMPRLTEDFSKENDELSAAAELTTEVTAGDDSQAVSETTAETNQDSEKAYLSELDIHPLYAAFLRNEIRVEDPFVPEGAEYDAGLCFFDDMEYDQNFRKSFSLVDVNNDGAPELVFRMDDPPSEVVYILGVQNNELICYDIHETHTCNMTYTVYDNGIVRWGQNYDGAEGIYYTFTGDGKVHELIHFVREEGSVSDLYCDYYYLEGNEESRIGLQSNEEYERLVSSYRGEEPEWFDCESFADIPQDRVITETELVEKNVS